MNINDLKLIKKELLRFTRRLQATEERINKDPWVLTSGCKETGALKRAALDLKMELTKIT